MDNLYDAEDDIAKALEKLFPKSMIFSEETIDDVTKETFKGLDGKDALAAVIIYSGYKVLSTKSRGKSSLIRPLWRVFVVSPSRLYKTHAGAKMVDVIHALQGLKVGNTSKPLELNDDVREFNEPDFTTNLFAIPSVFGFDVVISKQQ